MSDNFSSEHITEELSAAGVAIEPTVQRAISDSYTISLTGDLREDRVRCDGYSKTEDRAITIIKLTLSGSHVEATAVFDGHGGTSKISAFAAARMRRYFLENDLEDDSAECITEFLTVLDRILVEECYALSRQLRRGGTTGNITITTSDRRVYNINRGDSRIVIYNAENGDLLFESVDQDVENYQKVHGPGSAPPGAIITPNNIYFESEISGTTLMMFDSYGDPDADFIDRDTEVVVTTFQIPDNTTTVIIHTTDGLYEIWKLEFVKNRFNQYKGSGAFRGFVEERNGSIQRLIVGLYNAGQISSLKDYLIPDQIDHTCSLYREYLDSLDPNDRAEIERIGYGVDRVAREFPTKFDNHDIIVKIIFPQPGNRSVSL